jgi:hypothetical protein
MKVEWRDELVWAACALLIFVTVEAIIDERN